MKGLLILCAFPLLAQSLTEPQQSGWVLASSFGVSQTSDLRSPSPEFVDEHDESVFDLSLAYQFSNRAFVELSYFNLGTSESSFEQSTGLLTHTSAIQKKNEGFAINYRDEVRLFANFYGFLSAGLVAINVQLETSDRLDFQGVHSLEEVTQESSWTLDGQWGAGLSYEIRTNHNLVLKYEDKFDSHNEDNFLLDQRFKTLQLGWRWRFHSNE